MKRRLCDRAQTHGLPRIRARASARSAAAVLCVVVLLPISGTADGWILNITAASRRVFLHVGNGIYDANNGTINTVSVSVPGAQVGSGTPLTMSSNSTQGNSLLDNYPTCPTPATQVLIGASYRRNNAADPASATLRVTSPANLVSAAGDTIPISQISWTVSAPGSPNPNVIPAGTFTGGTQTLATVAANTYIENCHTFSYANSAVRPAGTYTAQVTYTLSSP